MSFDAPSEPRCALLRMTWYDLLFAHWPLDPARLAPYLPAAFELDTLEGQAWIGLVPFGMRDVSPVGLPRVPWRGVTDFLECNVRTYARWGARSGVWFLSLDAASRLGVWAARRSFHLNYLYAHIAAERRGDTCSYRLERLHAPPARLEARWRAGDALPPTLPGSLEHFLTERHWLFASDPRGRPWCGRVWHAPWSLRAAELEHLDEDLLTAHGLPRPTGAPHLLHADCLAVRASRPVRLD